MILLKFIFYSIVIYYLFVFFSRILFSFILKRWVNKVQKNIKRKRDTDSYQEHQEGDTVVQYKQKKTVDSDPGGEYVDFEDINDNS